MVNMLHVLGMWSIYDRYMVGNEVGVWSMHGRYVIDMWSVCGGYLLDVVGSGRYVVGV